MAWLSGWTYRKPVTISRATGAVTDYQMGVLVGESSGATGEAVDCGGLCKSDFSDLRFTSDDGMTLLDYWIESVSGATPNQMATIWVEFDSIGTSATTFYMYYGNSAASAVSDGEATFLFFDDFPGASLDGTKWSTSGSPVITVDSSIITMSVPDVTERWIYGNTSFPIQTVMRAKVLSAHANTVSNNETLGQRNNDTYISFQWAAFCYGSPNNYAYRNYNDGDTATTAITSWTAGEYHILEQYRNATQVAYKVDGTEAQTVSTYYDDRDMWPMIYAYSTNSSLSLDWLLYRKKEDTEPAFGSWGPQTAGTDLTVYVTESADDGIDNESPGTDWAFGGNEFGWGGYTPNYRWHGVIRFQDVTIPKGSTINSAVIKFYGGGLSWPAAIYNTVIRGDDVDNSPALGSAHRLTSGWTTTTATVNWTYPAATLDELISSASIVSIISEITSRAGWASGNALSLAFDAAAFPTSGTNRYGAWRSWDYNTQSNRPHLVINYTAPSAGLPFQAIWVM